jgi:hypothetical protein
VLNRRVDAPSSPNIGCSSQEPDNESQKGTLLVCHEKHYPALGISGLAPRRGVDG